MSVWLLHRFCGSELDRHTCVPSALATEISSALQLAFFWKRSQYTYVDLMLQSTSPKCMEIDCRLQKRCLVSAGLITDVSEMFLVGKGGRLQLKGYSHQGDSKAPDTILDFSKKILKMTAQIQFILAHASCPLTHAFVLCNVNRNECV